MNPVIESISPDSPAAGRAIYPGDKLVRVNGHRIVDVLDYKYYTYEAVLLLELFGQDGSHRFVKLKKLEGQDPGLNFETYLMDKPRACANRCLFCFVDQLPTGMRESLYFKDDDARLSFLQGNYITLTNLTNREIERIAALRVSPINVSVHATNPELRCRLLGNRNAGNILSRMQYLAEHGITMNCQIVCCPGLNDGEELLRTMKDLAGLYPQVPSVSVVPVGLTGHRCGLAELTPFDKTKAEKTLDAIDAFGRECMKKHGSRIFFAADEFYIKAGRPLPKDDWYEGYPQLENGVGLLRLLSEEFEAAVEDEPSNGQPFTAVTGKAAYPFICELLEKAKAYHPQTDGVVLAIENDFFGRSIDVAGLLTGRDILAQVRENMHGQRLLIPRNTLRYGEHVFLDDCTVEDLERELGVTVRIVEQDGADLAAAFAGR
ncbi:MAG: DUF512 domain-containing protein [Oscillospiraceae bacterium]|nr:DUF512 domain-containing protein [Oscillospiraceae bacterium]